MQAITLVELNARVRGTLEQHLSGTFWITAELSEVRVAYNGHCYVEFVQKDQRTQGLLAKARATIWRNVWQLLGAAFERETGRVFTAGLKVLVCVSVQFHELYGYSLTVHDIDPAYTLGDLAQRRKEILQQLDEEGVLTLNKELELPLLVQRIAVISSATAAGYGDFCDQLHQNPFGFAFHTQLFPAVMQGEQVEGSVIAALDTIAAEMECWDVVVIIRGGGASSDLVGFDTYLLAANCAQFPLPIITGIGHERDDTVLDYVAHTRVKTPTAAAEFLIARMQDAEMRCLDLTARMSAAVANRLGGEKSRIARHAIKLPALLEMVALRERHVMGVRMASVQRAVERFLVTRRGADAQLWEQLQRCVAVGLERKKAHLQLVAQQVASADPELILKKGYSLTMKAGRVVTDVNALQSGDLIVTRLSEGEIESIVQ